MKDYVVKEVISMKLDKVKHSNKYKNKRMRIFCVINFIFTECTTRKFCGGVWGSTYVL